MRLIRLSFLFCLSLLFFASCTTDEVQKETNETYFQTIANSPEFKALMEAKVTLVNAQSALDAQAFETFLSDNQAFFSNPKSDVQNLPEELVEIRGAENYIHAALSIKEARNALTSAFPDYDNTMSVEDRESVIRLYKKSSFESTTTPNIH